MRPARHHYYGHLFADLLQMLFCCVRRAVSRSADCSCSSASDCAMSRFFVLWLIDPDQLPYGRMILFRYAIVFSVLLSVFASIVKRQFSQKMPSSHLLCVLKTDIVSDETQIWCALSGQMVSHVSLTDGLLSTTAAHEVRRAGVRTCGSCHLERSARPHPHRGWSCQVPKTAEITLF